MKTQGANNLRVGIYCTVEELGALVDTWQQRTSKCEDLDFYLHKGGDNWISNNLLTNFKTGIEKSSIEERIRLYGSNKSKDIKPPSWCKLFCDALQDLSLVVLLICAFVSIAVNLVFEEDKSIAWIEGVAILSAVMISAIVGATNDYKKELKFQELNQVENKKKVIDLLRDGNKESLHVDNITVGDIVLIREGMEIAGDGILVEGDGIKVDESNMTGESDLLSKENLSRCLIAREAAWAENGSGDDISRHIPSMLLLSGTKISSGEGKYVVINVGQNSAFGKIMSLITTEEESTPLQLKLNKIASDIGKFGLVSAVLTLIFMNARLFYDLYQHGESFSFKENIGEVINSFIIAITVIVVAIPEGLPLAVTLSLAYSVKQMMEEKNLVRKLHACETMGGADIICSDKTGTLTKNEMHLTHFWNMSIHHVFKSSSQKPFPLESFISKPQDRELFVDSIIANSAEDPDSEKGSKTELALLKYLKMIGIDVLEKREEYTIIKRIPFSTGRKRMSTIIETKSGKWVLYIKGASEFVVESSTHLYDFGNSRVQELCNEYLDEVEAGIESMAQMALRTIGIGYRELPINTDLGKPDEYGVFDIEKSGLTMIGIFGIMDVLRDGVGDAVQICKNAGVKIKMITGDNRLTAVAVARNCQILDNEIDFDDAVMEGKQFMSLIGGVVCKRCRTPKCPCPRNELEKKSMIEKWKDRNKVSTESDTESNKRDRINNTESPSRPKKSILGQPEKKPKPIPDTKKIVQFKEEVDNIELEPLSMRNTKEAIEEEQKTGIFRIREDTIMNKEIFNRIIDKLYVLARSRPEDKYAVILGLKEKGHVVGVTGDGTNDAPALRKADVGFAMGNSGTDAARLAADIILTDDDFSSILSAIVWGRNIYDSIRKFLSFQLTVNIVAVFSTFVGAILLRQAIITAVQMLWINLIMDTLASLALATEQPDWGVLLSREPYSRKESIISCRMLKHMVGQSIFQMTVLLLMVFKGEYFLPETRPGQSIDGLVISGRLHDIITGDVEYGGDHPNPEPSVHFTYIFNVFVLMQVFNFMNARKLNDELNIFEGMRRSKMFIIIVILIIILQVLLVTLGYRVMSVTMWGLELKGWAISIGIGSLSLVVAFLLKFIPLMFRCCCWLCCSSNNPNNKDGAYAEEESGEDEEEKEEEEEDDEEE